MAGLPVDDVREVSRYVAALFHATDRMRNGFPLSLRLLRDAHAVLMQSGRGSNQTPGEFRRTQNWIGGTRRGNALFVPPPPDELPRALGDLERFIHDETHPPLMRAALAHAQFETIHPFLDGNGRIGRMLVTLILVSAGALSEPVLYLSLYFRQRRAEYYDALQRVRTDGDWEGWLLFFLNGVDWVSRQTLATSRALREVYARDTELVRSRMRSSAVLRAHDILQQRAVVSIRRVADLAGISFPTAARALSQLVELGIAHEITGRSRGRLFVYTQQLEILERRE